MRLPPDYHTHTPLCRHATGLPTEYAARAVALGFEEIGCSDHSPMARDDFDEWRMRLDQLDGYVELVRQAQRDHPTLAIKLALEVDYLPGHEAWIRDLAGRHPWDYFIGSVHYVAEGWDLDNPKKLSEWRARDASDVWRVYLERLTQAAASGLFDIIGHADLAKKFRFYPKQDVLPLFRQFLDAAKRSGTAIELNTAGLRKDCREIYPARPILALASEMGVPITFGSDAHAPQEVGADFASAIALARSVGYGHCLRFTRRKPEAIPF
jgi:histidinol-phosphatase (PHP family)